MGPSSGRVSELHSLCGHGALPCAAKTRTKNLLGLLCLTQVHPKPVGLSSRTEFSACASGNSVSLLYHIGISESA